MESFLFVLIDGVDVVIDETLALVETCGLGNALCIVSNDPRLNTVDAEIDQDRPRSTCDVIKRRL